MRDVDAPTEPTLRVDELLRRPWSTADISALVQACADPDIARWSGLPQPRDDGPGGVHA